MLNETTALSESVVAPVSGAVTEIRGRHTAASTPEKEMPAPKVFGAGISRCAAKTELCVTVFSLWALVSFDSRVLTAYPMDDQLIHPRELAVDLFNRASK